MKKILTVLLGIGFLLGGCAQNNSPEKEDSNLRKTVHKVKKVVKKILDPCERDKISCVSECKLEYVTKEDDLKRKACIAKCYTIYAGCKAAQAAKKGYKKTKEFIQENIDN